MKSVVDFKTNAWKENGSANRYHESTVNANELFQIIRRDLFVKYLRKFSKPGQKILDLGCGSGLVATILHDLGYDVVGCDVSEDMLRRFREEMGTRNIELRHGDAFSIPARNDEFDIVLSRMFIQHFPNWPEILREKARVTKPGGIIFYDFANREHLELAQDIERPDLNFAYSTDPKNKERFYAACSEKEIRKVVRDLAMTVIDIIPCGLLFCNAQFLTACGQDAVNRFDEELNEHLRTEKIRDFLMFLEEQFVAKMPKYVCYGNVTVIQKIA